MKGENFMIDIESKALDLDDLINATTSSDKIENPQKIPEETVEEKKEIEIDKKQPIIDNRLIIGQNDKHNDLFIAESSRYLNMLVLGSKGTGKTSNLLPFFAEQDISKKLSGCTFIVSDKEMAYNLYSICKQYKRKVHLLKPSIDNEIANKFLWKTTYDYDYINEKIINYKDAIRKKEIVIIDMEVMKYKDDAIRATAMLLLQLRLDLQETDVTQRHSHFLYVDDAYYYINFIDDFLRFGSIYNLGTILFLESRSQLNQKKDYRNIVEDYVRNTIILNKISMDDYHYYKDCFDERIFKNIFNRECTSLIYQTVDKNGMLRNGIAKMKTVNTLDFDEVVKRSKKIRSTLLKEKRKNREMEMKATMPSNFSHEPKPIDEELLQSIINETNYTPKIQQKENTERMEEEIREKIFEEEKNKKRKLAENLFNNYNSHIEFCNDLFNIS